MLDLQAIADLALRGDAADRAYADALVRMHAARAPGARASLEGLLRATRDASARAHAATRAAIAAGELRGAALRARFEAFPASERDHLIEEVLGVAYPPLDERALEPELVGYTPAGYTEIAHAIDASELGARDVFLDLGSGAGKVVLLAHLLTGCAARGIERDPGLSALAGAAAAELGLPVRFEAGDAREAALEAPDVVFLYLPFGGSVLAQVLERLRAPRPRRVCAGALDRGGDLVEIAPAQSWLRIYGWR